ncbi:unnamed protein product [Closterium sp. NIES-65]|nr:unnamed protein product [Closterium sp. NIES-65]
MLLYIVIFHFPSTYNLMLVAPLVDLGAVGEFKDSRLEAPDALVLQLVRLALSCTAMPASSRPSMLHVLGELVNMQQEMLELQMSTPFSSTDKETEVRPSRQGGGERRLPTVSESGAPRKTTAGTGPGGEVARDQAPVTPTAPERVGTKDLAGVAAGGAVGTAAPNAVADAGLSVGTPAASGGASITPSAITPVALLLDTERGLAAERGQAVQTAVAVPPVMWREEKLPATDVPSPFDLAGDDAICHMAGGWNVDVLRRGDQPFLVHCLTPQLLDHCLAIQSALLSAAVIMPEVAVVAYTDDITIFSPQEAACRAFGKIARELVECGLRCNVSKPSAWSATTDGENEELPLGLASNPGATIGMYHSQLPWERKRDKAAAVHPPTERSAAKGALARVMLREIQEHDELQHEQGHPLERRWVYSWEEEDERPAVYAEQADIWLLGDRAEKAVDKKREDFSGLEEAIERQRSRESYEQEFGSGDIALMAATKEKEHAQEETQEAGEEEGAKGAPRKIARLEEVEQPKQEPKEPSRK